MLPSSSRAPLCSSAARTRRSPHLVRHILMLCCLLILLSTYLSNGWVASAAQVFVASKPQAIPAHMTYQQFLQLAHRSAQQRRPFVWSPHIPPVPLTKQEQAFLHTQRPLLPTAEPASMQPIKQQLTAAFLAGSPGVQALDLLSSDKRLEVRIPAGAFDLSQASISGKPPTATPVRTTPTPSPTPKPPAGGVSGPLTLIISAQHGHFVGEMNELGQYQVQLLTAQGQPVSGVILRRPITFLYHYQPWEMTALDLDPAQVFLSWPNQAYADTKAHRSTAQDVILMTNNPKTHILSAQSTVLGIGIFALSGDPQNQSPPVPNQVSVGGNTGQVSYSYPLQLAPAPDGFAPQLALLYSSGTTNERQSVNSPAGDAGDGWSLSLGSITATVYPSGSAGGAQTWYSISGVDNISDRLVPDPNHSGWFLTQHLSSLRINNLLTANNEPCFQVWDTSDTYYQFGCTTDSLQYRYDSNGVHLYRWDLDEIVAPNDGSSATQKEIFVSYFQDCVPFPSSGNCPGAYNSTSTIRDAGIKQIRYGSGPWGGQLTLAGTIDFQYVAPNTNSSQSPWVLQTYGNGTYNCDGTPPTGTTNLRCDDPQNDPGGENAPAVQSTLSLKKVISYVGPDNITDGTGGYPAYEYDFTYDDPTFSQCTDPLTQVNEYCAGEHLLTALTPIVYQSGTAHTLQPLLFDYSQKSDTYYDSAQTVPGGSHYSVKTNWRYLADYIDTNSGVGEHIDYETAYNNSNGTPYDPSTGDNRNDPTFCFTHAGTSLDCNSSQNSSFNHPDNHAWSEQVIIDRKSFGIDSSTMSQAMTTYAYVLKVTVSTGCPADSQNDTNCVGDNWIPPSDSDWEDFYHAQFQGFNTVDIVSPADDLTVQSYFSTDGWNTSSGYGGNAFAGDLAQEDIYQGPSSSGPHLVNITNNYAGYNGTSIPCIANVNPYDPCEAIVYSSTTTTYEGSTASNPPAVTTSYYYDDYNPPGTAQSSWSLNLSGYHNLLEQAITGSNTPENPNPTITQQWTYTTTDSGYITTGWYFYDVNKVAHSEVDDSSGHKWDCQAFTYDEGASSTPEAGWLTTVNAYSSAGCNPGSYGTPLTTTATGYDAYGNLVASVDGVGIANPSFYGSTGISGKNGCTLASAPAIMSSTWSKTAYTTCAVYDSTYHALPTSMTNAFSQTSTVAYDASQGNLPISTTDVNSQQTGYSYSYDQNGNRTVKVSEPGEASGSYTFESVTNSLCSPSMPTGTTTPCFEIDTNSSLYPNAITRTYYDGLGRKVETRTPGPTSGNDTIQFTVYNDANHTTFTSVPFEVASGSSWLDPATATDKNGHTPAGATTFYDALGRVIATQDPIFGSPGVPGIACPALGKNATTCTVYMLASPQGSSALYDTQEAIDPNNHVTETFLDALGRTADIQYYSGLAGGSLTANEQISYVYNVLGEPTQVTVSDLAPQSGQSITSATTTMQYDDLGRLTQLVDSDRGTHTYTYDADSQLLIDTSGTRIIGYNDDLLGRVGCVQAGTATSDADGSCTSGSHPYIQNTYDTSQIGTQGSTDFPIGRLTKSVASTYYPEGGNTNSNELYQHDARGRIITERLRLPVLPSSWNLSLPTYQLTQSYNDADQPVTTTTSVTNQSGLGYTFTRVYDGTTGVLTGLSTNGSAQANLASLSYNVNALISSIATLSSTGSSLASEAFSYDGDLRPVEASATWQAGSGQSGTFFDEAQGYDPASNVDTVTTTMNQPNGQSGIYSETQNFCYDEQNRLLWAGNSGTQPSAGNGTCGSGILTSGFPGGSYSNSFIYTHLGQLWQGPVAGSGSNQQYLYCSSSAPHQLTGIYSLGATCANPGTASYATSYDTWGNVTSRIYNSQTATLSYNKVDQMVEWQVPNTNQAWYAYDASGNRTLQRTTIGSTTSVTVYAFGLEEYTYTGSGTLTSSTHYYSLAGRLIGELTGLGTMSTNFFLSDGLGSILGVFSNTAGSATLLSEQLFAPYGSQRSSSGNAISQYTNKGFTGQYNDSVSGLDYYTSRYYDPVAGVFLSADKAQGNPAGLNPYDYVGGNPETRTDPNGQYVAPGGGSNGGPPPSCSQLGTCNTIGGGTSTPWPVITSVSTLFWWPSTYTYTTNVLSSSVTAALSVKPVSTPPSTSASNDPLSRSITSCGVPGGSQPTCGDYGVFYALYTPGGVVPSPGSFCFFCSPGGGGDTSGEGENYRVVNLAEEFGLSSGEGESAESLSSDTLTGEEQNLGQSFQNYIAENLDIIFGRDMGTIEEYNREVTTPMGRTDIDIVTDKALVETTTRKFFDATGQLNKGMEDAFITKIQKYRLYAQSPEGAGRAIFVAYDQDAGLTPLLESKFREWSIIYQGVPFP